MFKLPPQYSLRLPTILKSEEARQARSLHADNLQLNDWQATKVPAWGLGFVKTKKSPAQSKLEQVARYMNAVTQWAQEPTDPNENRQEAVRRIKTLLASARQQTSLSIENLGLTRLPTLPPWIRELNVENNRLTSLEIPGVRQKDIRILSSGNPLASLPAAGENGSQDERIATNAAPHAPDSLEDVSHAGSPVAKPSLSRGSSASTIKPGRAGPAPAAEVMASVHGRADGAGEPATGLGEDETMDRAKATGSPGGSRSLSSSSSDTTIKPNVVRAAGVAVQGPGDDEALVYQETLKDWVDSGTAERLAERIHTAHTILDWIEEGRPGNMLPLPSLDPDERPPLPRGYHLALPSDVGAEPRIEAERLEPRALKTGGE